MCWIVETEVRSARDGFEVRGIKKFVSLSPIADHIMVVARSVDRDPASRHGNVVVIAVPTAQGRLDVRAAAAVKVTAARLGEEVLAECMHTSAARDIWSTRRRWAIGGVT